MSVNKYIDIDSTYRNRTLYPEVGDFVMTMNQTTGPVDLFTAVDPVALSFPIDTGRLVAPSEVKSLYGIPYLELTLGAGSRATANFYVGRYINFPYVDVLGKNLFWLIVLYDYVSKKAVCINWDGNPNDFPPGVAGIGTYPALVDPPPVPDPSCYFIRDQLPAAIGDTSLGIFQSTLPAPPVFPPPPIPANTSTQVYLPSTASSIDNFYRGYYLFLVPSDSTVAPYISTLPQTAYQYQKIIAYNGQSKLATVQRAFLTAPPVGTAFSILPFSFDNYRSIQYYGTEIFNQPRCVNLALTNLIVPAFLPLENTSAGFITDYPYVWVALYSEKNATYQQVVISAAPASKLALFKCAVYGVQESRFTQLSPIIGSQSVNFRINDDLRFQILLPNGEPIKFIPAFWTFLLGRFTYFPGLNFPIEPDPETQVQATFNISFSTR